MNIMTVAVLVILAGIGVFLVGALLSLAVFLPFTARSVRLLPRAGRTTLDGVTTVDDAVAACRASGLSGLPLAAFAQRLTARKYCYSRRNPWDSWERTFERGMGYCVQMTMALKLIYDRLGIEARPVQSLRCRFPPSVVHGLPQPACVSGHIWLRVRIDGTDYDVCPGDQDNTPGALHFQVLAPVRTVPAWLLPVLHTFSAAENVRRDWRNLFAGRPA